MGHRGDAGAGDFEFFDANPQDKVQAAGGVTTLYKRSVDLVEEARKQKALDLLANSQLSLDDISEYLGYSDLANFTRAFKRWTEQTPTAYRKSLVK